MIRPWYRSFVFYLGIPGFLFLLWGWVPAPVVYRGVTLTLGEYCLTLSDKAGVVGIEWEVYGHGRLMAPGLRHYSSPSGRSEPEQQLFPKAVGYEVFESDYHLGRRSIPRLSFAYWFLLALYLPAWGTLVAVWQRRKARLLEAPLTPPS